MKSLIVVLVAAVIALVLFWDDLFGPAEKENDTIVVNEEYEGPGKSPTLSSVSHRVAGFIEKKQYREALQILDKAGEKGPLSVKDLVARQQCLQALGRSEEAGAAIDDLLSQTPLSSEAVDAVLATIEKLESDAEKRVKLSRFLLKNPSLGADKAMRIVALTRDLNGKLPQSISVSDACANYTVKAGDNLWDICRGYGRRNNLPVEIGVVKWLNNMPTDTIFPDQTLKLPSRKITAKVWKKAWLMGVFLGDTLLEAYRVGLGKENSTPRGLFVVSTKQVNPEWKGIPFGDPRNPLGTRWVGLASDQFKGYGIHGTEDPASIGMDLSEGCVRLLNEDVEHLFELLARGTEVEIL